MDDLKEYFNDILSGKIRNRLGNRISGGHIMLYFKYYNKELYVEIKNTGKSCTHYIYDVINSIISPPECDLCSNTLRFIDMERGYGTYCSKSCQLLGVHNKQRVEGWSFKQEHLLEQMKQNNIERY